MAGRGGRTGSSGSEWSRPDPRNLVDDRNPDIARELFPRSATRAVFRTLWVTLACLLTVLVVICIVWIAQT